MKVLKSFVAICFIVGITTFLKLFVFDSYYVPSNSMSKSIKSGDYIIANKIAYGSRWPKSPLDISWFNLLALNDNIYPWFRDSSWPYKRWPKGNSISRNDVVLFDGPWNNRTVLVKRCKGLPNDTIMLKNDHLYINNVIIDEPSSVSYIYSVSPLLVSLFDSTLPYNNCNFHPRKANEIRDKYGVNAISPLPYLKQKNNNFGPIIIPAKGTTINLNQYKEVLKHYKNAINRFENSQCSIIGDSIFVNGKLDSLFTFQNNYYFMMGDNRHGSEDSRKWGLVPEQNIIGKAQYTWFSKDIDEGDIRWSRMFKKVK